jgi:Icc protein
MRVMAAVRFIQFTDTHLTGDPQGGIRGVVTLESLHRVLQHAQAEITMADAILPTGDIVHDDAAGYAWIRESLASLGPPVLAIPDNHDDPQQLRAALSGPPFHIGGTHAFADSELTPLEAALSAQPHHALIVLHHQPVAVGSPWLGRIDSAVRWAA